MDVGGDRGHLGVGHGELGIERGELEMLLVLPRAVVAMREREDQRIVALQLAETPEGPRVIGQLVVRERAAGCDIGAHQSTSTGFVSDNGRARCRSSRPWTPWRISLVLSAH